MRDGHLLFRRRDLEREGDTQTGTEEETPEREKEPYRTGPD